MYVHPEFPWGSPEKKEKKRYKKLVKRQYFLYYVNKNTNSYQFPQTFNKHNKEIVFERVELVDSEHSLCLV
jgi:hypothetical protein